MPDSDEIEDTLEPELVICDSHQHFWDFRKNFPPERYLLHEFVADIRASGHNVRSSVFVEARTMYRSSGPENLRSVGEVEFAQGLAAAAESGVYGPTKAAAAIVGQANLDLGEAVAPVLDALVAASPNRFRGVRYTVTWDPHSPADSRGPRGMLADSRVIAGGKELARRGLIYDAWLNFHQLEELAQFARTLPDLVIVVNHTGGPLRIGYYAGRDSKTEPVWRRGMTELAKCPNVFVKLGGLGMERAGFGWKGNADSAEIAESSAPYLLHCIDQFGPDRCMFESNSPADQSAYSYRTIFNAFKRMTTGYSKQERAALFHDTAVRVYKIAAS